MSDGDCLRCGDPGHWARNCPNPKKSSAPQQQKLPPAPPSDEGSAVNRIQFKTGTDGSKHLFVDIPGYQPGPLADAHAWANRVREADPRMGLPHCGDSDDLSRTEFRRTSGLGPAHECRLRLLAAQQVTEAREIKKEAA